MKTITMSDQSSLEATSPAQTFAATSFKLLASALAVAVIGGAIYLGGNAKGDAPANAPLPSRQAHDDFAWQTEYQAALQIARKTGKPVLIDFAASWCGPCQLMERQVWSDAEVQQRLAKKVVPLKIDVDSAQGETLAQRYTIQAVPTMLLVDGSGKEVFRFGFASADDLNALLDRIR